ncbi:hypothetical protein [Streptomyces sp. G-G2]|uniref:hypothetical protein n=1 Tax=Streptomyces sp. G-G2 TaxID=3046201 RepID=UPI0024B90B98|nr:hypothetical protein [Streptomyces sp. G-G2]MDJ0382004.1 hypothetical protein [Streptomyces sp. G-G2]
MTRTVTVQGVVFDLDDIVEAHLQRGYAGGVLDLRTADDLEYTFELYIRDSAADYEAYVMLKHHSGCYSESWPRGWGAAREG